MSGATQSREEAHQAVEGFWASDSERASVRRFDLTEAELRAWLDHPELTANLVVSCEAGHDCWGWKQSKDSPEPVYPPEYFVCDECLEDEEDAELLRRWTFRWSRPPLHGPQLNRMAQLQGWHDRLVLKLAAVEAVCDRMESAAWRDRWDSIGLPDQPEYVSSTDCIMSEVADGVNRAGAMLREVLDA